MPNIYSNFVFRGLPVSLETFTLRNNDCIAGVENGSLNAAVITRLTSSNINSLHIWRDRMVLLCNKNAPYNEKVHPCELNPEYCIYIFWSPEYSKWHEFYFGQIDYKLKMDNLRHAEHLLEDPKYWVVVPYPIAVEIETRNDYRHVDLSCNPPDWDVYLISGDQEDNSKKYLVEDIINYLSSLSSGIGGFK